jgi:hypothetical protein
MPASPAWPGPGGRSVTNGVLMESWMQGIDNPRNAIALQP